MKGTTAQIIIKSLKGKRFEGLLAQLSAAPKGDLLVEICQYLQATDDVTEADMRAAFQFTPGQYYHAIDVLGGHLANYLGARKDEAQLEHTFQLARELVAGVHLEAAVDVIRAGIKSATQVEQFELLLRYWELMEMMHNPPKIDGMEEYTARRLRSNLNAYSDLYAELRTIAKDLDASNRRFSVSRLLESKLLSSEEMALSQRALHFFLKTKVACYSYLRNYEKAIVFQEALLVHVQSFPWLCIDLEFTIAKSTVDLAIMLRLSKQNTRFIEVSNAFSDMKLKGARAILERDYFNYPVSIAASIQFGNSVETLQSTRLFLQILDVRGGSFSPTYITENLYCCLYGALALRNIEIWVGVLRQLSRYGKPDFKPKLYPMYRFLEIIHSIESKDWEDAMRLIRNLKGTNSLDELQGFRETLSFLSITVSKWSSACDIEPFKLDHPSKLQLKQITTGIDLVDYFDLGVWFEAMELDCPMMKIFHHRANNGLKTQH